MTLTETVGVRERELGVRSGGCKGEEQEDIEVVEDRAQDTSGEGLEGAIIDSQGVRAHLGLEVMVVHQEDEPGSGQGDLWARMCMEEDDMGESYMQESVMNVVKHVMSSACSSFLDKVSYKARTHCSKQVAHLPSPTYSTLRVSSRDPPSNSMPIISHMEHLGARMQRSTCTWAE